MSPFSIIIYMVLFSPAIVFVFYKFWKCRDKYCPVCQTQLLPFQPFPTKTIRQWKEGGYRCHKCGCLTDLDGNEIPSGPRPNIRKVMFILLLLNMILAFCILLLLLLTWLYLVPK